MRASPRSRGSRSIVLTALGCAGALLIAACEPDPCAELVRKTCGDVNQCAERRSCQAAEELQQSAVTAACAEALDNPISYPACQKT